MISESKLDIEGNLLSCPFSHKCNLPKIDNLCNFPEYKICPDYQKELHKLKSSSKVLH